MILHVGKIGFCLSRNVFWFRAFGYGLMIRSPWNRPLFSERYGYAFPTARILGWRLFILKPERP